MSFTYFEVSCNFSGKYIVVFFSAISGLAYSSIIQIYNNCDIIIATTISRTIPFSILISATFGSK